MPARVYKRERAPGAVARSGLGEIQRARILVAVGEVVVARGAERVTVADIVERSGVSRRTFYELYADRDACFAAAFDRAVALAVASVAPAYASHERWRERMRAGLCALLVFLDTEPNLGYLCLVGSQAAGPHAMARRKAATEMLVDAVHEGASAARAAPQPARLTAEGVVGAVLTILANRVALPERPALLPLLNALMAMIALPYLGTAAANRELGHTIGRETRQARASVPPRTDGLRDLDMRLTYRTVRTLLAIADLSNDGCSPSNRQVAAAAGIADQGQISKLLSRLQTLGLIENTGGDHAKGEPNAWRLTARGETVTATLQEAA